MLDAQVHVLLTYLQLFRIMVEQAVHEHIFSPLQDANDRTQRLIHILAVLNDRQRKAFLSLVGKQAGAFQVMTLFMDHLNKYEEESDPSKVEPILEKIIMHVSATYPDQSKAQTCLQKYAKANDKKLNKLLQTILSSQTNYVMILKCAVRSDDFFAIRDVVLCLDSILQREFLKRIEPQFGAVSLEVWSVFLRRISLTLVNADMILSLLNYLGKDNAKLKPEGDASEPEAETNEYFRKVADSLMNDICKMMPFLFKSHISFFCDIVTKKRHNDGDDMDLEDDVVDGTLLTDALKAFAKFVKMFPAEAPKDE